MLVKAIPRRKESLDGDRDDDGAGRAGKAVDAASSNSGMRGIAFHDVHFSQFTQGELIRALSSRQVGLSAIHFNECSFTEVLARELSRWIQSAGCTLQYVGITNCTASLTSTNASLISRAVRIVRDVAMRCVRCVRCARCARCVRCVRCVHCARWVTGFFRHPARHREF